MERRELIRWLVSTAGLRALDGLAPADLLAIESFDENGVSKLSPVVPIR